MSTTREQLIAKAAEAVAQYPQYAGHFDKYILVRIKRPVRTKLGLAFTAGEVAIAYPKVETHDIRDPGMRHFRHTRVVWSTRNRICTSIPETYVEAL